MKGDDACPAYPVRPRYNRHISSGVLQGAAAILVNDSVGTSDDDTESGEAQQPTPMPRVRDLIASDPRSLERRRELEMIREESAGGRDPDQDNLDEPQPCDNDDGEPVQRAKEVYQPTTQEFEDHRHDHYPYRNWCPFCARARATGQRHLAASDGRRIPIIGVDYCFLTPDMRILRRDELAAMEEAEREALVKILLTREHAVNGQSGCIFGSVVPQKGVDEDQYAVAKISEAVSWMGHSRVIVKGDNEPALKHLVAETLKTLRVAIDGASDEHSAKYDPKSNGGTEVGVRIFKDQLRTLKLCLEDRIGKKVPIDHPIMTWLVDHTSNILNTRP